MKRLFVVHTQYNLILACGMSTCADDLILFCDFALSDDLRQRLDGCFCRCLILVGNYPKRELSAVTRLKKLESDCGAIGRFIDAPYDEILIVDDMCVPEMYALKCAHRLNRGVAMSWLEDGSSAYYPNDAVSGGMGKTPLRRLIRRAAFGLRFRLGRFYDLGVCMGAHRCLTRAYLTFPDNARDELRHKSLIPITDDEFRRGLGIMYGGKPVEMDEDCVVIAVDKLNVYGGRLSAVSDKLRSVVENATRYGRTVYCKYHPRETERLDALRSAKELDSKIAMEHYLTNTTAAKMTVVGVMSTSLMTARKLGYEVMSLADSERVVRFYRSIGIEII